MRTPSIDIIIVNWNAGRQLGVCLESIAASDRNGYALQRVVVIDNASTDGSAERLSFPSLPLELIRNRSNRGFGGACNQGAAASTADYLLFLNPDTKLFPDTLTSSVEFMEQGVEQAIGISTVKLTDETGAVARCCSRFPTAGTFVGKMLGLNRLFPSRFPDHFYVEWDHANTRQVDQVMGAYLFIRRQLFGVLNGFDERFFVYFEDVDISFRALSLGWKSFHNANGEAFHKGHGTSEQVRGRRLFYSLRSRLLYAAKHFSMPKAACVFAFTLIFEPISRTIFGLLRGRIGDIPEISEAYWLLYTDMPRTIRSLASRHNQQHSTVPALF